jgi:DNA helicase-2/ATP-dependent DNA helicase PcrA
VLFRSRRFEKNTAGPVAPLAQDIFEESGLAESLRAAGVEGKDALENVGELINAAAEYDGQAEQPSLIDYLQQISLFSDADAYDPAGGRVALMTLHAAKGLEFENVFIVGVEQGLLPHERTNAHEDPDEFEEERRLFFVGITRAKTNLHISYARYRTIRGQKLRTIPSQFLFELGCGFDEQITRQDDYNPDDEEHYPSGDARRTARFDKGQLVRHEFFGLGRVKEFIDIGQDSIVVVKFNTGHTKSLMLRYAHIVKL